MYLTQLIFTGISTYLAAAAAVSAREIPVTGPAAIVEIQQTLNLFPISVDTKNYTILADIFTVDATADFVVVPTVHSLAAIQQVLQASLAGLVTQHSFTTQVIKIQNRREASAITYLIGNFFGQGELAGQVLSNYGQYQDSLRFVDGQGWRVDNRTLVNTVSSPHPSIHPSVILWNLFDIISNKFLPRLLAYLLILFCSTLS